MDARMLNLTVTLELNWSLDLQTTNDVRLKDWTTVSQVHILM